jgi:hypothetical protein
MMRSVGFTIVYDDKTRQTTLQSGEKLNQMFKASLNQRGANAYRHLKVAHIDLKSNY